MDGNPEYSQTPSLSPSGASACSAPSAALTTWEYILATEDDAPMYQWALDSYGANGWELVAVLPGHKPSYARWIFKRPGSKAAEKPSTGS